MADMLQSVWAGCIDRYTHRVGESRDQNKGKVTRLSITFTFEYCFVTYILWLQFLCEAAVPKLHRLVLEGGMIHSRIFDVISN